MKKWSAIFVLLGMLVTFLALYLEAATGAQGELLKAVIGLLQTLGITLVGMGIFNVLIETRDWRDFFEERIKSILINQDYISKLDQPTLQILETKIYKSLFKNQEIDRPDGFLDYFKKNLHHLIAEPYREDVRLEIDMRLTEDGFFNVKDKVTYVCRASGDKIQQDIRWIPDKDEFHEIEYVRGSIQFPYNHSKRGEKQSLFDLNPDSQEISSKKGVTKSLDGYEDVDGLVVTVDSAYKISPERFQVWEMAHPTKSFSITLTWEGNFEVQHVPLVLNKKIAQTTEDRRGYFNMKYDSWMLPNSGMAWRLIRKV